MITGVLIVPVLLTLGLLASARAKLTRNTTVMANMAAVGVPEGRVWQLAVLEIAGAAGLVAGLFWWPLGVAAAIGVIAYFVGALAAHARRRDRNVGPAVVFLGLGIAALVLRLVSA